MMMIEDDERWREDAELWISIHYVLFFLLGSNTIIVLEKNVKIISILDSIIICVLTKNILGYHLHDGLRPFLKKEIQ